MLYVKSSIPFPLLVLSCCYLIIQLPADTQSWDYIENVMLWNLQWVLRISFHCAENMFCGSQSVGSLVRFFFHFVKMDKIVDFHVDREKKVNTQRFTSETIRYAQTTDKAHQPTFFFRYEIHFYISISVLFYSS